MPTFRGRCHCGNVEVTFETGQSAAELPLRACACSFCRAHAARCTSDPDGSVSIAVRDADRLGRYRFGLKTADFLVCTACGVYLGAVLDEGEKSWAILNVNAFDDAPAFVQQAAVADYDNEPDGGRRARRRANWTPVKEFTEGRA